MPTITLATLSITLYTGTLTSNHSAVNATASVPWDETYWWAILLAVLTGVILLLLGALIVVQLLWGRDEDDLDLSGEDVEDDEDGAGHEAGNMEMKPLH
jgi:hypothetical protein